MKQSGSRDDEFAHHGSDEGELGAPQRHERPLAGIEDADEHHAPEVYAYGGMVISMSRWESVNGMMKVLLRNTISITRINCHTSLHIVCDIHSVPTMQMQE